MKIRKVIQLYKDKERAWNILRNVTISILFDADTLRAAQKEPEKYKDLQIRVCGWNVLFNNISKEEQDGFIKQAEELV